MYKRNIGYLIAESLKFFFNFDHTLCNHTLLVVLVAAGFFKLFFTKLAEELHDGILTVKEDILTIRSAFLALDERLATSAAHQRMINSIRTLKNNFPKLLPLNRQN